MFLYRYKVGENWQRYLNEMGSWLLHFSTGGMLNSLGRLYALLERTVQLCMQRTSLHSTCMYEHSQ